MLPAAGEPQEEALSASACRATLGVSREGALSRNEVRGRYCPNTPVYSWVGQSLILRNSASRLRLRVRGPRTWIARTGE